jgi:hypothetical protein
MLVKLVEHIFVFIVELHVKLEPQQILELWNCGNESQIRLTHTMRRFTHTFLPPGFLTKIHNKISKKQIC